MKQSIAWVWMVALVVVLSGSFAHAETPDDFLASVAVKSHDDVVRLSDMGLDIAGVGKDKVSLVLHPRDLPVLERAGFHVIRLKDGAAQLKARFAALGKAAANAGAYHTYDETTADLQALVALNPKIAKIEKIGQSFEKRDVLALRITAAPAKAKVPKMLVLGLHHSREWISVEVPLAFARTLVEGYGKDAAITKLVDGREIVIVPIVNPDGLIWSQTQYSYWRKNRNDNGGSSSKGVDPNRNYGYQWGLVGSSDSMSSDTYHGKGPFSEPCTQNVKRLAEREKFTGDISFHSSGEMILYPWSYAYNVTNPDHDTFVKLAKEMAQLNKYNPQESCSLYPSMGDTDDFLYGQMSSLSMTIELATQFIPAESEIKGICDANVKALLHMLGQLGTIHAKSHPDYASNLRFRSHQVEYLAGVAKVLGPAAGGEAGLKGALSALDEARAALLADLAPARDASGAKFRDLTDYVGGLDPDTRDALRPVVEGLRALYLQDANSDRGGKTSLRRAETLNLLLPTE